MTSLEKLLAAMISNDPTLPQSHGQADWSSLPTFGGREIEDTSEIWSWDAENVIIGTSRNNIEIISRTVYDIIR